MPGLLNDGPKCEDVINSLTLRLESSLSSSSKLPPLKLQMEDYGIEFGKREANQDRPIIVGIHTRARLVDQVNNVM
jgi:hypothetical protein